MFEDWSPPSSDELEVSVFARGSGEAIVVHVGDGKWLAIDSLSVSGRPIGLTYLETLGVDVTKDVELVVATHWHDDHIHGLADLYQNAESAAVSFPQAMFSDEFRQFAAQFTGVPAGKISSGVKEFGRLLALMSKRGWVGVQFAKAWTTLVRHNAGQLTHGMQVEVEAISPSDFDVLEFLKFIARHAAPPAARTTAIRAPHYDRNDVSCAMHIRVGDVAIVLGADLENVPHAQSGWKAVFSSPQLPARHARLLKIPHHGSITGEHPAIWSRLCVDGTIATLTPWARGDGRLPKKDDVDRIREKAGECYSAARTVTSGDRHRLVAVNSVLKRTNSRIRNVDPKLGHVRHRLALGETPSSWSTKLFGAACELKDVAA